MRFYFSLLFCVFFFVVKAQKKEYQAILLDAKLVANADAVVRLNATSIEIAGLESLKQTHKRVVTILNSKGNDHLDLKVYYDDKIKVKNLGAIAYDKFGKQLKKFKSGDFKDMAAVSSFSLYEDSRVKYLSYVPNSYPYTIEFYYETTTSNTTWIPFWRPLQGYNISTEKSTYDIVYDSALGLSKKEKNFRGYNILDQSKNGVVSYIAENLEAIEPEELSPDFRSIAPVLLIAPLRSHYEGFEIEAGDWETMGKWIYDNLLSGSTDLSEETKKKVLGLVEGINSPLEKARVIYNYVQNNTRYVSVQVGIGGIRPIPASEVDRVKYGDCKGLTNYTRALLEVVGVTSYYTEVYASANNQIDMDKSFPSLLGQANHVILNIPIQNNKSVWLECTSQSLPFNFLGDFTDNRNVLAISPEGGKIIRTPKYDPLENSQVVKANLKILDDRSVVVNAKVISEGLRYNKRYYLEKETLLEKEKFIKSQWGHMGDMDIDRMDFHNDKESVSFTQEIDFRAGNFSSVSGSLLLIPVNTLNKTIHLPQRYRNRKMPLEIERGFSDNAEYDIHLPKGYKLESTPDNLFIENKFGKYSADIEKVSESRLKYTRQFVVYEGVYPKEEYADYRSFIKEVSKNDNAKIILTKNN